MKGKLKNLFIALGVLVFLFASAVGCQDTGDTPSDSENVLEELGLKPLIGFVAVGYASLDFLGYTYERVADFPKSEIKKGELIGFHVGYGNYQELYEQYPNLHYIIHEQENFDWGYMTGPEYYELYELEGYAIEEFFIRDIGHLDVYKRVNV